MAKISGTPSAPLGPSSQPSAEPEGQTRAAHQARGVVAHTPSDSVQAELNEASPASAPRISPPSPPSARVDIEGAQSFAASLEIWASTVDASDEATEYHMVFSAAAAGLGGSQDITAEELDFLIARIMGTSNEDMKYWDEYFARVLALFRKKKDIKLEAVAGDIHPQLALKYLPGGFHSVGMPTERNASYELIEASQKVADLVSALSDLGEAQRQASITG